MTFTEQDHQWMREALRLAQVAESLQEVPVGAVVVNAGRIIASAHNQSIQLQDPTAHAEVLAIRQAAKQLRNYRLPGTTLYTTLEPCTMCLGAIIQARVTRIVAAASDPKTGACGGAFDCLGLPLHQHKLSYEFGLMASDSANLLRQFFRARR